MRKRNLAWILMLLAIVGSGGVWIISRPTSTPLARTAADSPAVPVTVVMANRQDVPLHLRGLGNVQAYNTITIHTQVDGQLRQIAFKEGQEVRTGELLAQIDPRTYQAAVDQALAKKAQDEAQLVNARLDLQRYTELVTKNYVARQQLDTTRAQVDQLAASLQGDEAAIENARVMLGYTTIKSPIDGRVGIRQVDAGNIVHANDANGIVVITQVHPISVLFTLPEENLPEIIKAMAAGPLPVTALSRDGKQRLDQGVLDLVDNQIDPSTGTIRLKATMPNKQGRLWPGQFVNAELRVGVLQQVVTIPATAVQRGLDGAFAFVIKNDGTAEIHNLILGEISEDAVVIRAGIQPGDSVVTEGQYRLQPGTRVEAKIASASDSTPAAKAE
jgi:multidrug efflux system membrane fusion protein